MRDEAGRHRVGPAGGRCRAVRRGLALGAAVLLLVLALGGGGPASAQGEARLTRGPYLQDATPSTMTVLWRTDSPTAPTVEYRADDTPGAPWLAVGSGERAQNHAITVTGLAPDRTYRYRVLADGRPLHEGSVFRTLPDLDADELDFVVYGDNRTNHGPHGDVMRAILRDQPLPRLIIHTGDFVEHGARPEQWETFFQLERELLARVPLFPALGNHEEDSPLYFESFRFPSNSGGGGRWYSFDAGPAHFVALDVVFSELRPGGPQYRWLEADLARSDQPWKFVYFHYPVYNASQPHGSNVRLREVLEPLFLAHGVTAVFTGHAHIYERATGAGEPPLLYLVSGGGGAPQHKVGLEPWTRYTEASYHFVRVRVRGDRLTTTAVRLDGSEFDPVEAQRHSTGRLTVLSGETALAVPGPSPLGFLGSRQGLALVGYTVLFGLVAPLAMAAALPRRRKQVVPVPLRMSVAPAPAQELPERWRGLPVGTLVATVGALVAILFVLDAPLQWLIGFDPYSTILTFHAAVAIALIISTVAAATLAYRLAHHGAPPQVWLRTTTTLSAVLALLSAVLGNVLYAGYLRSGGPKEELIRRAPDAHKVLFEFKEYAGLVPLPLAVAAAFIVWRYSADLRRDRYLAELLALLALLLALYCLLPLGLGASLTRLRGLL